MRLSHVTPKGTRLRTRLTRLTRLFKRKPVVLFELVHHRHSDTVRRTLAHLFKTRYSARLRAYTSLELSSHHRVAITANIRYAIRGFRRNTTETRFAVQGIRFLVSPYRSPLKEFHSKIGFPETLTELEDFKIKGILIGDLIYDHYCKHHRVGSPDIWSENFRNYFIESVEIFDFWDRYFEQNNVLAIFGSAVYRQGIVARIAIHRGIKVLHGSDLILESLSEKNFYSGRLWRFYPELFQCLDKPERDRGIAAAATQIAELIEGKARSLPYPGYEIENFFGSSGAVEIPLEEGPRRIVILTHDVFDSTHEWGKNFHPDYLQWFRYVCELSKSMDGEWFVKNHPVEPPEATMLVEEILQDFPNIIQLPPNTSPQDMRGMGITIGLTVRGTVAAEYPLLGFTVINCSQNTPHRRYGFSLHPASLEDFESMLLSNSISEHFEDSEIFEYRFMRWGFPTQSYLNQSVELVHDSQSYMEMKEGAKTKEVSGTANPIEDKLYEFIESDALYLVDRFTVFENHDKSPLIVRERRPVRG